MNSAAVLVIGSANLDMVFQCDRIPKPGETILGTGFSTHPGGKGANQAVAIGRLDGRVAFMGCVGSDAFGDSLADSLRQAGVDLKWLSRSPDIPTGTACIVVDSSGMNSIVVAPGANGCVTSERVEAVLSEAAHEVVLCQLEIPLDAVEQASKAATFILNPAPACPLPEGLLARCAVITPNESETAMLTGIDPATNEDCLRAGKSLLDRGVKNVVITRGAQGSYWVSSAGGGRSFPAPFVSAIDTTAAGDAFNGALAVFLAEGRDMANAIALANCVGALSTTKRGAQESMPTLLELKHLAGDLY